MKAHELRPPAPPTEELRRLGVLGVRRSIIRAMADRQDARCIRALALLEEHDEAMSEYRQALERRLKAAAESGGQSK